MGVKSPAWSNDSNPSTYPSSRAYLPSNPGMLSTCGASSLLSFVPVPISVPFLLSRLEPCSIRPSDIRGGFGHRGQVPQPQPHVRGRDLQAQGTKARDPEDAQQTRQCADPHDAERVRDPAARRLGGELVPVDVRPFDDRILLRGETRLRDELEEGWPGCFGDHGCVREHAHSIRPCASELRPEGGRAGGGLEQQQPDVLLRLLPPAPIHLTPNIAK